MSNFKPVWADGQGDLRKKKDDRSQVSAFAPQLCELKVRRLTSGKGRTVVEISDLPADKNWCKDLAKAIKKKLGIGGSYKNNTIEVHGEKLDQVTMFLDSQKIKWKKIGG